MHNPSKPLVQADEAVIRAICGVLLAEDMAMNLLQPSGIGQRPRPMEYFSLSDMGKPPYSGPSDRSTNYSNYSAFNTNDSLNSNGMLSFWVTSFIFFSCFSICLLVSLCKYLISRNTTIQWHCQEQGKPLVHDNVGVLRNFDSNIVTDAIFFWWKKTNFAKKALISLKKKHFFVVKSTIVGK